MNTIPTTTGAEARHEVANLLATYTEIADRKDIDAVLDLLGDSVVTFPADGFDRRDEARGFFERLWGNDIPHRHDISNLRVHRDAGGWTAAAHYSRHVFAPDPALVTLGAYELRLVEGDPWRITHLTVTRTWSR